MNRNEVAGERTTYGGKPVALAVFENEDYEALKSGEAVDNNGLRSRKGNYWTRQPRFVEITPETASELSKRMSVPTYDSTVAPTAPMTEAKVGGNDLVKQLALYAGGALLRRVVFPLLGQVTDEYVIPWLKERFGDWFRERAGHGEAGPERVQVVEAEELRPADEPASTAEKTPREDAKIVRFPA